ncbi:cytokine receptor family member b1 isoform X2 [Siniperca chuatsi]|uniref:cytokine receptor family member b1 isoform X2 n=1 Tax=Siniperca chuatsi TaxID=119488 RepID=UPI001CE17FCC|nr:cytokine receptor family member b1 isoform X2 [Siniperca chuatsi]XP_044073817.1 cytokine receptor family member b1 isoform X2 [Siniperca chuatsi]
MIYGGKPKLLNVTKTSSIKVKLDNNIKYYLTVKASYNQTLSPESSKVIFTPFKDTKIGSPKLSLAGCGKCIQINISLPEADRSSRIDDIQKFYNAHFKVSWKKREEAVVSCETQNKSYTLNNLEDGMEYCVQVHTKIYLNKNTEPSTWNCIFTSIVEPSRGPHVLGAVAALLFLIVSVLMTTVFCLYYTGFLCKLMSTLPRSLTVSLSQGYTLTPERTIHDQISISSEMEKQRTHNNPTTPQPATRGANSDEEDEEEEEEGTNIYMDRDAELSSGSCWDSGGVSRNSTAGASGGLTVEAEVPDTKFEVEVTHGGLDRDEANAEGAEVSFMPEGGQSGVQRHVIDEEEKEEVCDSSGNVDLFSVTVAALAVCDEEEKEGQNTRDSLTELSNLEPLLPTDSKQTLSHTDSQTESDDQMLPTQEDFTAMTGITGYEGRRTDTLSGLKTCDVETQEEEEEEEFSGYIGHT